MELTLGDMTIEYGEDKYNKWLEFECDNDPYYTKTGAALYSKSEVEQLYKFLGEVLGKWEEK